MDAIEAIRTRRAIRAYEATPVERGLIEEHNRRRGPGPAAVQRPDAVDLHRRGGRRAHCGLRRPGQAIRGGTPPGRSRLGVDGARRLPDLLGRAGGSHHLRTGRGLLPRRPEPDALGPRQGPWNLLGRLADAVAENRRGQGGAADPAAPDARLGAMSRLSRRSFPPRPGASRRRSSGPTEQVSPPYRSNARCMWSWNQATAPSRVGERTPVR